MRQRRKLLNDLFEEEELVENVYFCKCESCGREFDFVVERRRFKNNKGSMALTDCWKKEILCCDCAMEEIQIIENDVASG